MNELFKKEFKKEHWIILGVILFIALIAELLNGSANTATTPTAKVNDVVRLGSFDCVIGEVKVTNEMDKKRVVVNLSTTNRSNEPETILGSGIRLVDDQNRSYDSFYNSVAVKLNPGMSNKAAVSFNTPLDAKGFKLRLSSSVLIDLEK